MKRNRLYQYLTLAAAFLIGNYQGYIALWTGSSEKPTKVFPYSVASLPPADQARVNAGIHVDSEEELRQMVEDYLS